MVTLFVFTFIGGVGSSCAALSPVHTEKFRYQYEHIPSCHTELKGLLTGHLVHLVALCLNYSTHGMPRICHRMDKA